jgi:LPXTG-motif cell wall-anchored protein
MKSWIRNILVVIWLLCLAFGVFVGAQVQSTQSTTAGQATQQIKVESGEVIAVEGNDLFVKMADGTVRHFPNVPDSARVDVNGAQLGIHDLKPGMKLQRTTVTTTTPMVVTTVQTVSGKVWNVNAPLNVILTMDNGQNQMFKIPEGTKFTMADGTVTDAFGLRKGMVVTATKITEAPETVVTKQKVLTGTLPTTGTILVAKGSAKPAPATTASTSGTTAADTGTTATASARLPKTGSELPLIGLLGLLSVSGSFGVHFLRRMRR